MSNVYISPPGPRTVAAAVTLTAEDASSTILIQKTATPYIITLPSATLNPGLKIDMLQSSAADAGVVTIDSGAAAALNGSYIRTDGAAAGGAVTAAAGNRNLLFSANTVRGDRATFVSDGAKWNVFAVSGYVGAGISFT